MNIEDKFSTRFIQENLLTTCILTALENEEIYNPWKLIRNSDSFTLVVNFSAKDRDKGKCMPLKELKSASQHTDKKHQDSPDVRLAEQQKQNKKKETQLKWQGIVLGGRHTGSV